MRRTPTEAWAPPVRFAADLAFPPDVPAFMSGHADLDEELSGIWIGSQGCVTPLHFDPWHGILCQVRGRKRVTLFSPEDTENIYPRKQANSGLNQHISELVLERMAEPGYLEMYPLAEELTPWCVQIHGTRTSCGFHRAPLAAQDGGFAGWRWALHSTVLVRKTGSPL